MPKLEIEGVYNTNKFEKLNLAKILNFSNSLLCHSSYEDREQEQEIFNSAKYKKKKSYWHWQTVELKMDTTALT